MAKSRRLFVVFEWWRDGGFCGRILQCDESSTKHMSTKGNRISIGLKKTGGEVILGEKAGGCDALC